MKQRKSYNPSKGWENHWVHYADGVMEPVRDGQDISQKKSGPGQHGWMVVGKPVGWHPFDEGRPMTLNRPPKTTGQQDTQRNSKKDAKKNIPISSNPFTGSSTDFGNPFASGGTGGHFAASFPLGKTVASSLQQATTPGKPDKAAQARGKGEARTSTPSTPEPRAGWQSSGRQSAGPQSSGPRSPGQKSGAMSRSGDKLAGSDRSIGEQFFQSLQDTVSRQEQAERQGKLAGADRQPSVVGPAGTFRGLKLAGADRVPGQNVRPGLDQTHPAPQNTPQPKQDGRSRWAREYAERGFFGNLAHAGGQLGKKVPGAVEQAAREGGKAAGKALAETAEELATNEELQKALLGTLGAGSVPLWGTLATAYGPAVAATVAEKMMTLGAGITSVDKLRETALAPETWERVRKGMDMVGSLFPGPPPNPNNIPATMGYLLGNLEAIKDSAGLLEEEK